MNIKGGCYCSAIRYESKGEVQASIQCHCRECQYITGGNPNVIMVVPLEEFRFVSGKPKEFKRSDLEIVLEMRKTKDNLEVVLTGKRRQYLINNLKKENIKFHYFEMVDYITLNNLYNTLDLYIVSSRVEGGPRALFECAITKTPVISTDVGFASNLLAEESLFEGTEFGSANPNVDFSKNIVKKYEIPRGFENFINMFSEIYES